MEIRNHKLVGVDFIASPNVSGNITPKFIVEHYTAGWSDASAIATFKNPRSKVSAHLVIGRRGEITQMVPFNVKAWHAGPSRYDGYSYLNSHSIGIENVNIGYFQKGNGDHWIDPYGRAHTSAELKELGYDPSTFIKMPHKRIGSGTYYWPTYTQAQINVNKSIVEALGRAYNIRDVVSHEQIDTRGWKTDPGPAFPLKAMRSLVQTGGRADPEDAEESQVHKSATGTVIVTVDSLNLRRGPGTKWEVRGSMPLGTPLTILDTRGDWMHIKTPAGYEGWVHSHYVERTE